jgi:hypothetical protein
MLDRVGRVAAIDLGTNSTRLLVADVADGRVDEVRFETTITRLGEGVDRRRRLLPLPIARVRNCLSDYRRTLESLRAERTLLVATSAVRDAENGEALLGEIEWSYGFETRLLSGHEEAMLTLRGVTLGRELSAETLVADPGGGSTELLVGGPDGLRFHDSLDVGSGRLTERFLTSDPPAPEEVERCAGAVRALLAERVPDGVRGAVGAAIGTAGLLLVLDLARGRTDAVGVACALLAMVGAAFYFVLSSRDHGGLPGTALAAGGLLVGGLLLLLAGVAGVVPLGAATLPVAFTGFTVAWWVPVLALGVVTAAGAYGFGIAAARRLGARLASFVALSEVLAALGSAWLLLGQAPGPVQLFGGVLIVGGVVAVRRGEPATRARRHEVAVSPVRS